ncbi:hypothetical protein B0J14DRAFT_632090 [Halenospora varia]|nr:hypothetical protein B0J14DRAFT_632090 [Halenospora varia]
MTSPQSLYDGACTLSQAIPLATNQLNSHASCDSVVAPVINFNASAASENLLLFVEQLPDPQLKLYWQTLNPLETFTEFAKLPPELRTMIWKYTYSRNRKVHIKAIYEPYMGKKNNGKGRLQIRSRTPPPAAMKVNRESRQIALGDFLPMKAGKSRIAKIWFNPKLDTLSARRFGIYSEELMKVAVPQTRKTLESVQYMLMQGWWWCGFKGCPSCFPDAPDRQDAQAARLCHPNLKGLVLVAGGITRGRGLYIAGLRHESVREACVKYIAELFKKKQEMTPDFKVPSVTLTVPPKRRWAGRW